MNKCLNGYDYTIFIRLLTPLLLLPFVSFDANAKTLVEELAEMSIEQLMSIETSSTSFFDIPQEKAPGAICVISGEKIESAYASSISDFLEYHVPGVNVSGAYSAGALSATRGIASSSNATILYMLDGESMNISNGVGINTNLDLPLLGYMDRIEVLKGPCSIIHGSGSINGFINVIQKNGAEHPGGFVNSEAGFPHNLVKVETGYGFSSPTKGDFFFYAGTVESEGIEDGEVKMNSFPESNSRFSLNWEKENFRLTTFLQNEVVDSTLKFKYDKSGYSELAMNSSAIIPEMDFHLTDTEVLTLGIPIKYFEYDPDYLSWEDENQDSEWQVKSRLLLKTTRFAGHRIALGGSLLWKRFHADSIVINVSDIYESGEIPDFAPIDDQGNISFEANVEWLEASIFIEDNYQILKDVMLFAGLRYDGVYSEEFEFHGENVELEFEGGSLDMVTPRFGITWDLDDHQNIKLIYQEGYHYPQYINYVTYGDIHELLTSEEVKSYEIGYHLGFLDDRCRFSLNGYYNVFKDSVFLLPGNPDDSSDSDSQVSQNSSSSSQSAVDNSEQLPDEADYVEQIITDSFASAGFEVSLYFAPDDRTWFDISYGFSHPHNTDATDFFMRLTNRNGENWKVYPEHIIKFNMGHTFFDDRLDMTLGCLYNAAVTTVENNLPSGEEDGGENQEQDLFDHNRIVVNAGLRYHLTDRCSLFLKGKNIFDNDVPSTGYYYDSLNKQQITLEEPVYTIGLSWMF
ncbi:TonB-dependent receptor [Desulfamplus magnetovallimortis]|nr:TonB-dependent receptor [Desulfamplus magnetovallimortis]